MFNTFAYAFVDSIQTAKKQAITTFVTHEGIAKALNQFVDAQTAYTKSAIDAGIKTSAAVGEIVVSEDFARQVGKSVKDMAESFLPAAIPTPTTSTSKKK